MRRVAASVGVVIIVVAVILSHGTEAQIASSGQNTSSPWVQVSQTDWVDITQLAAISFDSRGFLYGKDGEPIEVSGPLDLSQIKARLTVAPSNWIRVRTLPSRDNQVIVANLEWVSEVRAAQAADGPEYQLIFPGKRFYIAAHLRASIQAVEQMLRSGLPPKGFVAVTNVFVRAATQHSGSTSRPAD